MAMTGTNIINPDQPMNTLTRNIATCLSLFILLASCESRKQPASAKQEEKESATQTQEIRAPLLVPGLTTLDELEEIFGPSEAPADPSAGNIRGWRTPQKGDFKPDNLGVALDASNIATSIIFGFGNRKVSEVVKELEPLVGTIRLQRAITGELPMNPLYIGIKDGQFPGLVVDMSRVSNMSGVKAIFGPEANNMLNFLEKVTLPADGPYFGESIQLGDFRYVVQELSVSKQVGETPYGVKKASKTASFVIVRYEIENIGKQTATALAGDLQLIDLQDRIFTKSVDATMALAMEKDVDLSVTQLQPGIPRELLMVFELPTDVLGSPLTLRIPEKGLTGTKSVEISFILSEQAAAKLEASQK